MTNVFVVTQKQEVRIQQLLERLGSFALPFLPSEYWWLEYIKSDITDQELFERFVAESVTFVTDDMIPDMDDLRACICSCGNPADIGDGSCVACHTGITSMDEERAAEYLSESMKGLLTMRMEDHMTVQVGETSLELCRSEHPHSNLFEVGYDGYWVGNLVGDMQPEGYILWHVTSEDQESDAACTMRFLDPYQAMESFAPRAIDMLDAIQIQEYGGDYGYEAEDEGPFGGAFRDQEDYENWRFGGISYLNSI